MGNAAGAYANRAAWNETDPYKTSAFSFPVGPDRQGHIEKALQALGRQGGASVFGLIDYDGAYKDVYQGTWEGRYLIQWDGDGAVDERIVCHAKPFINADSYALSNEVYKHIRQTDYLQAPELLSFSNGALVQKMDEIDVAFTSFVAGRPVDPNISGDMFEAARGISVFKNSIQSLPQETVSAIAENGRTITERIQNGISFMLSSDGQNTITQMYDTQEARALSDVARLFEEEAAKSVVPCHSDLIPGNYYLSERHQPLFLDFDNVGGSMFPADVDIGTVAHRIGVERSKDRSPEGLKRVFTEVIDGYNSAKNDEMTPSRLMRAMKLGICWKLSGSFAELAQGISSYVGAEAKVRIFGSKALEIHHLSRSLLS